MSKKMAQTEYIAFGTKRKARDKAYSELKARGIKSEKQSEHNVSLFGERPKTHYYLKVPKEAEELFDFGAGGSVKLTI